MSSLRLFSRQLRSATPVARALAPTRTMATAVETPKAKTWTRDEVQKIYDGPLMDLIFRAVRLEPLLARDSGANRRRAFPTKSSD